MKKRYRDKIFNRDYYGTITIESAAGEGDLGADHEYVWAPYRVTTIMSVVMDRIDDQLGTLDALTVRWRSLALMTREQLMDIRIIRI
jgi:hypothetical protein